MIEILEFALGNIPWNFISVFFLQKISWEFFPLGKVNFCLSTVPSVHPRLLLDGGNLC